jgi:signal peptidase I
VGRPIDAGPVAAPTQAGLWLRVGAKLLDQGLFALIETPCLCAGATLNALGLPAWCIAAGYGFSALLWYVYVFAFTCSTGQTIGKRVARIQVVGPDGQPPRAPQMFRRLVVEAAFDALSLVGMAAGWALARAAEANTATGASLGLAVGSALGLANPGAILCTPGRQAFHDLAAGTHVIRQVTPPVRRLVVCAALAQLLAPALLFGVVRPFFVEAYIVPSGSMEPTIQINDRILANKLVHRLRPPRHGEIVMFRAPQWVTPGEEKVFVKRVVGLPGDKLQVKGGKLWRNGQAVPEPFLAQPPHYEWPEGGGTIDVPPDSVVILGDARNDSNDSHHWESLSEDGSTVQPKPFLPMERIVGNLVYRFWPPDRMGTVTQEALP